MNDNLAFVKEVLYLGKESLTFAALMIGLFLSISSHQQSGETKELPST